MNPVAEEMKAVLESDSLAHYGMPRRSGRYPWGSGEDPYQHGRDFLGRIEELKKSEQQVETKTELEGVSEIEQKTQTKKCGGNAM